MVGEKKGKKSRYLRLIAFAFAVLEERCVQKNLHGKRDVSGESRNDGNSEEILDKAMRPILMQILALLAFFLQFNREMQQAADFSLDPVRVCFEPDSLGDACDFLLVARFGFTLQSFLIFPQRSANSADWETIPAAVAYYKELVGFSFSIFFRLFCFFSWPTTFSCAPSIRSLAEAMLLFSSNR
jgi:hypothetical protein